MRWNPYVWTYEFLKKRKGIDASKGEWVVDEDGDVFTRWLCPSGKTIDPKHIRQVSTSAMQWDHGILIYCPPLDVMAPPERKTVYVDVMATTTEGITEALKGDDRYPHGCPSCGGAAYIGLFSVDCRAKCQG